jgi:very-short-patch-repair endonuclease
MSRRRDIELMLRELGAAQQGVVGRAQLRARGFAVHVIARLVRTGRLIVLHRGVYQVGPLPAARAQERAATIASREGCISHRSAAGLHQLHATLVDTVEVTLPRRRRRRIEGVRIHRARDLLPDEVTTIDGIPVTTPARTLLDISAESPEREVEQALANAFRLKLVTRGEVLAIIERHPTHRGAPGLRGLLAAESDPAFTRSQAEEKLLAVIRRARLPAPELNVRVLGHEVDVLWRTARVIAEVDGFTYHGSARSFTLDRRRDAELTAAGYRVLRFTWADVTEQWAVTVVRLAQALAR